MKWSHHDASRRPPFTESQKSPRRLAADKEECVSPSNRGGSAAESWTASLSRYEKAALGALDIDWPPLANGWQPLNHFVVACCFGLARSASGPHACGSLLGREVCPPLSLKRFWRWLHTEDEALHKSPLSARSISESDSAIRGRFSRCSEDKLGLKRGVCGGLRSSWTVRKSFDLLWIRRPEYF